jgi:hypothetical protein
MTVKAAPLAMLALVALGQRADAHPEFSAVGTNRYVMAAVFDRHIDVSDALLEGALTGAEERRRLDGDADGLISDAELTQGEIRLRTSGPLLTVQLDGKVLTAPVAVSIDLGGDARVTAAPLVVERRLRFEMPGLPTSTERHLRLALDSDPPRLMETEIGVVLGPGLALGNSSGGAATGGGTDRLHFQGPRASALQDRSATFVIVGTTTVGGSGGRTPGKLVALAAVGALLLAAALSARRRARLSARG